MLNIKGILPFVIGGAIIIGGVGYYMYGGGFNSANVSAEKVIKKEINLLSENQKLDGELDLKIESSEIGKMSAKINYQAQLGYKNKQGEVDLDILANAKSSISPTEIKDLKLNFNFKFLEDKFYFKANLDIEKVNKMLKGDIVASMALGSITPFINKYYYLDLNEILNSRDKQEINAFKDDFKKNMEALLNSFAQNKPFSLIYVNEKKRINGYTAGKFKISIDEKKLAESFIDVGVILGEFKETEARELKAKLDQELNSREFKKLKDSLRGELFVWVTEDNLVVKTEGNLEFTGPQNEKLTLSLNESRTLPGSIKIKKPMEAENLNNLLGNFLGTQITNLPVPPEPLPNEPEIPILPFPDEGARNTMENQKIMAEMSGIPTEAMIAYAQSGSYANTCSEKRISKILAETNATCRANNEGYVVFAPLTEKNQAYCLDTNGFRGKVELDKIKGINCR